MSADPIAIFGPAVGFVIVMLTTACAILWKRLINVEDRRDAEREATLPVMARAADALTAANDVMRDMLRRER